MEENEYITTKTFLEVIGIFVVIAIALLGFLTTTLAEMDAKIEKNRAQFLQIETKLSEIQTDVMWIKESLGK